MALLLFVCNLYYIDQPYIDVPDHAEFNIQLRFGPAGELLGFFNLGVWDRFGFGISYGASNLIGVGDPDFYEIPGVQVRIVAIEQGSIVPEVLLGFDNQGYGDYDGTRYAIMSKGLYCQIGKTFAYPSIEIVPSFGLNYSFEGDKRLDLFCGLMTQFGSSSALMIDYSPNLDDDNDRNQGYFNISLKFLFYEELFFEFALRDLLDNSLDDMQFNRMIRLGYQQIFW